MSSSGLYLRIGNVCHMVVAYLFAKIIFFSTSYCSEGKPTEYVITRTVGLAFSIPYYLEKRSAQDVNMYFNGKGTTEKCIF